MSGGSAVVNLDDDDLQFTDSTAGGTTHTFSQPPDSTLDEDDDDDQTGLLSGRGKKSSTGFWSLEFYQQFFDVDTDDVKKRVAGALIPRPGKSFLEDVTEGRPDLYGPFWICTTLVVSVAVAGNLASYLQAEWSGNVDGDNRWHYDFHKVTLAATAVFSYAWLVPSGIYGYLWWTSATLASLSFLDLICLYGYALVIYIPLSVLWLIQNSVVQWILAVGGAALSGAVIVFALYPALRQHVGGKANMIILVVAALHLLMACGFMLCFFHVPSTAQAAIPQNSTLADEATTSDGNVTNNKTLPETIKAATNESKLVTNQLEDDLKTQKEPLSGDTKASSNETKEVSSDDKAKSPVV